MNQELIDSIARAVLYEGYALYPYRPSLKNQQRWTFGAVLPRAYCELHDGERWMMQTECLVEGGYDTVVRAMVRFLHVASRTADADAWQEANERQVPFGDVRLAELLPGPRLQAFKFPSEGAAGANETARKDATVPNRPDQEPLNGAIELFATSCERQLFKLTVRIFNLTTLDNAASIDRTAALLRSLVSTHTILNVSSGQFVSMIDPPANWKHFADECTSIGLWPALVGQKPETDTLLCSPIILDDYPQIAPESPGDFFDSTEVDEILTLRILTLTASEKQAMGAMDPRTRALLARTQSIPAERLSRLHGVMRGVQVSPRSAAEVGDDAFGDKADARRLHRVRVGDTYVAAGDRVRLCPRRSADAFDLLLNGRTATIVAIEQDYEDQVHLAVTIDDDPGADIGRAGKIAHRFFFRPDEVEPLSAGGEGGSR